MNGLHITIQTSPHHPKKILVEMDADRLEHLAASLGFFSDEFLSSLERAESDYTKKRVQKIKSLKDLVKN